MVLSTNWTAVRQPPPQSAIASTAAPRSWTTANPWQQFLKSIVTVQAGIGNTSTAQGGCAPSHRPRLLQRRFQFAGTSLRRGRALAACARADPRNRHQSGTRNARGTRSSDRRGRGGRRPQTHPPPRRSGTPPDIVLHNRDGSAVPVAPHHILSTDRVRHVGAAVAFVIAETVGGGKGCRRKGGRRVRAIAGGDRRVGRGRARRPAPLR